MPAVRKTLVIGISILALIGVGTGVAIAANSNSTTSNQAQARKHPGLLARTEHGEFTTKGPKHQVIDVQRGQVQAISANSITVKSNDGFTATYTIDSATKLRQGKKTIAVNQIAVQDQVVVLADKNGSTDTARRVVDRNKATS